MTLEKGEFLEVVIDDNWWLLTMTMTGDNNITFVEELVLDDKRLNVKKILQKSRLSETTVCRSVQDNLGMSKTSARWILKHLSTVQPQC